MASEPLRAIFSDLKSSTDDNGRSRSIKSLRDLIESQSRELTPDNYKIWLQVLLKTNIGNLVNSTALDERIVGLIAVDELIDATHEDSASIIASYLRIGLKASEPQVLSLAAKALGHLARINSVNIAEAVEFEIRRALEYIQGQRSESKRHSACLIIRELAINSPTQFYGYVSNFIDLAPTVLRDPKPFIRESASEALGACFRVLSERENSCHWHKKIFDNAQEGFTALKDSFEAVHASLLSVEELAKHAGDFIRDYYMDVCRSVMSFKDSRNQSVRKAIISLLPHLAALSPEKFSEFFLHDSIQFLLQVKKKMDRGGVFLSIGEIAVTCGSRILPHLVSILTAIKAIFTAAAKNKSAELVHDATICIGQLAKAAGSQLLGPFKDSGLLDLLLDEGFNETLIATLSQLSQHVVEISDQVQDRLLDLLSAVLKDRPFEFPVAPAKPLKTKYENILKGSDLEQATALALRTLGSFNFTTTHILLSDLLRESAVLNLDHPSVAIRKEAVICTCNLMVNACNKLPISQQSSVIFGALEKLLPLIVLDLDASIRETILRCMDHRFDKFLSIPSNLQLFFPVANDPIFSVRELALVSLCRLSQYNPGYVLPELRRFLVQLLSQIEYGDGAMKEACSKLLGILIKQSTTLVSPYAETLTETLLSKLQDPNPHVATGVLSILGELTVISQDMMVQHFSKLIPFILELLQDQRSHVRRLAAIEALCLIVGNSGCVSVPLFEFPKLQATLLSGVQTETHADVRRGIIRALGILGALDPYKERLNRLKLEGLQDEELGTGKMQAEPAGPGTLVDMSPSSEDYYTAVTMASLISLLEDATLDHLHHLVLHTLLVIVKALGPRISQFLRQIMPLYFSLARRCRPELRGLIFQQLGLFASKVKQTFREYLKDVISLVQEHWSSAQQVSPMITLLEELSTALRDEFTSFLPQFLPHMLQLLQADPDFSKESSIKVLHAFRVFGSNLAPFSDLVIPPLMKLAEQTDGKARIYCLATLNELLPNFNCSSYSSALLHPLARMVDATAGASKEVLDTLCVVFCQLGRNFLPYSTTFAKIFAKHNVTCADYDSLMSQLREGLPLVGLSSSTFGTPAPHDEDEDALVDMSAMQKIKPNMFHLKKVWEVSQRSTKEDWLEWLRNLSIALLRESPLPALRACISLANEHNSFSRQLFNAAFVSCWLELQDEDRHELVRAIQIGLASPSMPLEVMQVILNLAEFMEQVELRFPIDTPTLGVIAEKCRAYAKALHYKEQEYLTSPAAVVESLISINDELQKPEAALGILTCAQRLSDSNVEGFWYEKLQRWELALSAYERKGEEEESALGRLRCLHALSEWEQMDWLAYNFWKTASDTTKTLIAPLAAASAWNLGKWDQMATYVKRIPKTSVEGGFYRAVLAVHDNKFDRVRRYVNLARDVLDVQLTAMIGESYNRAYSMMVQLQQLAEIEEIVTYKKHRERRRIILELWDDRINTCERSVDTWRSILSVRSLVLSPQEDVQSMLKFAALCRKTRRFDLSDKTLTRLIAACSASKGAIDPLIPFAHAKQLWGSGSMAPAYQKLRELITTTQDGPLLARMYLKLGQWQATLEGFNESNIQTVIGAYTAAIQYNSNWYKSWHAWAFANYEAISFYENEEVDDPQIAEYLGPAIKGFFRSIALAPDIKNLQDTLRLLTLVFKHGSHKEVEVAVGEGLHNVRVDTWLQVVPQILAHVHNNVAPIRKVIHDLLVTIGRAHPQALVFPLTVASKSISNSRVVAAVTIMEQIRKYSPRLVEETQLVSGELIRISVLWPELWLEALEDASRAYFQDQNIEAMMDILRPMHEMMERGPHTPKEAAFQKAHGRDLEEAAAWCKKYMKLKEKNDNTLIRHAWSLYSRVFNAVQEQIDQQQLATLEMPQVSPKLANALDLAIAVPGTYKPGQQVVTIKSFNEILDVFTTKQRPRKLIINGADGFEYKFLLKGHEDLRQDERVMQLFGLVNTLLNSDYQTSKNHLVIQRYTVVPLSPTSGLIGWVPHSDTLHQLIRDYRDSHNIRLDLERQLMLQLAPDSTNKTAIDKLTSVQKTETLEYALQHTDGRDLEKIFWLKSSNSEAWLERRTNYTTSTAVQCMVGYILGLGDRHPSNLMIDKITGKMTHIDFGDCFEIAMHRERYPEKIPFRLTRMLINAMEVSGIEGTFRLTCENVMRVLRDNKQSLIAVLEAFVYDPIINWRLLIPNESVPEPSSSLSRLLDGGMPEISNTRALQVVTRVSNKLTGSDFGKEILDVPEQVDRLIKQATSTENLAQCYFGWCPHKGSTRRYSGF
eukprot:TRINITY_DN1943_c0_g1_i2.p1 TRINITY_DN1943_c0_g1~~TRINITY_DN1943_c0_g1_i2.p1  ORF type:complete len:2294 (+),score=720.41 TRINITY_DN1943_c0_g1_i2:229-7110(+)